MRKPKSLTIRLSDELRDKLVEEAGINNRSLAAEVELMIERALSEKSIDVKTELAELRREINELKAKMK